LVRSYPKFSIVNSKADQTARQAAPIAEGNFVKSRKRNQNNFDAKFSKENADSSKVPKVLEVNVTRPPGLGAQISKEIADCFLKPENPEMLLTQVLQARKEDINNIHIITILQKCSRPKSM